MTFVALLGELQRRRFRTSELKETANIVNQSCGAAWRIRTGRVALCKATFHATLVAAVQAGHFEQVANAPGVPADLALFDSYRLERKWLTSCG